MKSASIRIGPRTIKTAAAVIIAMVIVHFYGTTTSRLVFAMLGAMAAVEPTFTDSLRACLAQILGVLFGAVVGVALLALKLNPLAATGTGIVLVITLYNFFRIRFSPTLPCLIVVTLCTTADIQPAAYAMGRIWDSAIGLGVGMLINTLVFPYDNSRQIRSTVISLERELLRFLEAMFDGDEVMPDATQMERKVNDMARQLTIFSNQRLWLHLGRQRRDLENFSVAKDKARELWARMTVLSLMGRPGRLTEENRLRLISCGARIRDDRPAEGMTERDIVTNYHVSHILTLRQELLDVLK